MHLFYAKHESLLCSSLNVGCSAYTIENPKGWFGSDISYAGISYAGINYAGLVMRLLVKQGLIMRVLVMQGLIMKVLVTQGLLYKD